MPFASGVATGPRPESLGPALGESPETRGAPGVHLWPATTCLISELAAELGSLSTEELRATEVVLPTKRLAVWLLAMLSEERPAFVPPRCATLDEFVTRHAECEDPELEAPMGDLEQELLLAALLKDGGYKHLRFGHEHEARQLYAELDAWGLGAQAFEALRHVIQDDIYRSDIGLNTLLERVEELAALQARFQAALDQSGRLTTRQATARLCARLADKLARGEPLPCRRVYLAGFTSLQGCYGAALRALGARPETQIWITEAPSTSSGRPEHRPERRDGPRSPIEMLLDMIDAPPERTHRRAPTAWRPEKDAAHPLTVQRAPSILAEIAQALKTAAKAIDQGLAPSAVALLVTDEATYGKPLRALLEGVSFHYNLSITMPLATTTRGCWLRDLLALLQGEDDTARVLAFLTHPLTPLCLESLGTHQAHDEAPVLAKRANSQIVTQSSSQSSPQDSEDAWRQLDAARRRTRLSAELLRTGIPHGLAALAASSKLSPPLRRELELLRNLVRDFKGSGDTRRSVREWTERLSALLAPILASDHDAMDAFSGGRGQASAPTAPSLDMTPGLAASSVKAITEFLHTLGAAADGSRLHLSPSEFLRLASERLLSQDVQDVGDPLCGVQILSVEEARYVPFDLVIVLGAAEGQFPRAIPQDNLLDNYLKTRIGLPGWQWLEAIEDTTFRLLRARLPSLLLLYPASRGDEPVVRSRFIETALVSGEAHEFPVDPEAALIGLLQQAYGREEEPSWQERPGARAVPHGLPPEILENSAHAPTVSKMSATALESLIRCPYRYLLHHRLGLRDLPWTEVSDARQEGDWLHDVLEAFFTGRAGDRMVCEPLDTRASWTDFRAYALERLDELTRQLAPTESMDASLYLHLRRKAWPAFVDHLAALYEGRAQAHMGRGLRELRIEEAGAAAVTVGDQRYEIHGMIDAVEMLEEAHLIIDYKRGYTAPRKDVQTGVVPQLPLYALALDALKNHETSWDLRRAIVGYWSILGGTFEAIAAGEDARASSVAKTLGGRKLLPLEEVVDQVLELWRWRQDELASSGGAHTPDPSRCDRCTLGGVCRRDDPEIGGTIADHDRLNQRLSQRLNQPLNRRMAHREPSLVDAPGHAAPGGKA